MRTPSSTDRSYSNVSWGVRFIRSSCASSDWSTPWAAASPSSVACLFFPDPSTLTYTVACRRSGDVSTPVTVTNPIRGSLSVGTVSDSTCLTASFTRRIRSVMTGTLVLERHDPAVEPDDIPLLAVQPPLRVVEQAVQRAHLACGAGHRQPAPLPQIVMVDLGDRCAEPVLQLRLCRQHVLALALQRPGVGKVELDREDPDVSRHLRRWRARAAARARPVRSRRWH